MQESSKKKHELLWQEYFIFYHFLVLHFWQALDQVLVEPITILFRLEKLEYW